MHESSFHQLYAYLRQHEVHANEVRMMRERFPDPLPWPKNSAWFKEKVLLAQDLEAGVVFDEERMAFLADDGLTIATGQDTQELTTTAIFQTDDLDAFDLNCDEAPSSDIDITSDNNVISDDQYLKETENEVAKFRTKVTGQNEVTRGFEHIRKAFKKDVIPFVNSLRETFTTFDQGLFKEITKMKEVFIQIETEVEKCSVERKYFEIEKKEVFIKNDRLLKHTISHDVICIVMHTDLDNKSVVPTIDDNLAYAEMEQSFIDEYSRCVKLEAELSKMNDMVKKDVYNEISKWSLRLEQHCINLEIIMQQRKESLRNQKPCNNQNAPEFPEFFEINE
ncbi:hypothetical protein Tco_1456779 [Tanacetum coccineum]